MILKIRKRITPGLVLFLGFVLFTSTVSLAQPPKKIDWDRMQRDLDIMEGVLNKLLAPLPFESGLLSSNIHGVYFEDYGVVIQIDQAGHYLFSWSDREVEELLIRDGEDRSEPTAEQREAKVFVIRTPNGGRFDDSEDYLVDLIDHFKDQITEFLGNYADAIGQLKTEDRFTILVNLENRYGFFPRHRIGHKKEKEGVSILEITAGKKDIIEYRRGKISTKEFRQRLVFKEESGNEQRNRDIAIMSNILDTALSKKYQENFGSAGKTSGVYLKGLGALFFMEGEHYLKNRLHPITEYMDKYLIETEIDAIKKEKQQTRKKADEMVSNYRNVLIDIVADYGHTLRTLEPNEYVVVSVDFSDHWGLNEPMLDRLILKVRKKYLDAYGRGDLKLSELHKKIEVQEF